MTGWSLAQWLIALVVVCISLVVSVWAGGRLTVLVLSRASRSPDAATTQRGGVDQGGAGHGGAGHGGVPALLPQDSTDVDRADAAAEAPLHGGRWIGRIERFAVTLAILFGFPAAIAIIVAIKGLGRYPEIRKSASASEKFVIGTLTSLVVSAVVGALGHWALVAL